MKFFLLTLTLLVFDRISAQQRATGMIFDHLRTILHTKLQSEMAGGNMAKINPNAGIFSPTFVYEQITQQYKGSAQYPASFGYGNDFPLLIIK